MENLASETTLTTGKSFSHEEKWEKGPYLFRLYGPDFKIYIFGIVTANPTTWLKQNLCLFLSSKNCLQAPCEQRGWELRGLGALGLKSVFGGWPKLYKSHLVWSIMAVKENLGAGISCAEMSFVINLSKSWDLKKTTSKWDSILSARPFWIW